MKHAEERCNTRIGHDYAERFVRATRHAFIDAMHTCARLLIINHAVNWEAISAIGQIVGAIAVVISLIYLAREIRSNARSAPLASVGTLNRCLGQLATHPHLAEVWNRADWLQVDDSAASWPVHQTKVSARK